MTEKSPARRTPNDLLPQVLLRRLESIFDLTAADRAELSGLPMRRQKIEEGQDIVQEGSRPSSSFLILEGFVCSYKLTGEGKRQIPAFYVPGDMPDLHSLHLRTVDTSFRTISKTSIAIIQHRALHKLFERSYRLASAFWRLTLIDASLFREWETNMGQRDAKTRLAHVLCEIVIRLRCVGLVSDDRCPLPMTQQDLGDAMGLTNIHVNRMMQNLRRDGLISISDGWLQILDWSALKARGDFDPMYLHLEHPEQHLGS